jgi:hypothetical protein
MIDALIIILLLINCAISITLTVLSVKMYKEYTKNEKK